MLGQIRQDTTAHGARYKSGPRQKNIQVRFDAGAIGLLSNMPLLRTVRDWR